MEKITRPTILDLPKMEDPRGNLTFVEEDTHLPFKVKRAYWIYDVPGGEQRGGHAFKEQEELIIALSGSFDVIIRQKDHENRYHLNRSYYGLYIPSGLWRHMENFSTNAVVMVLSSTFYNEEDYIWDFNQYLSYSDAK